MAIANQYSYLIFSAAGILLIVLLLRARRANWRVTAGAVGVILALASVLFFALRPGVSDVNSAAAARVLLTNGKPTLLEFFSNYCAGCMAARPQVDALLAEVESAYPGALNVLRIDIHTEFGRELREEIGFSFSPEFVLFNAQGQEIWRSNTPPIRAQIERLTQPSISDAGQ